MPTYHFHRLDRDNRILNSEEVDFATDRDVVAHAMEKAGENAIEVWEGERQIAYIAEAPWPIAGHVEQMRKRGELPPE